MILKRALLLVVLLILPTAIIHADTLTVGSPVTGYTLSIHDSAVGSITAAIDPYHGTINAGTPSAQNVLLFCVDPDHFDNPSPYNLIYSVNGVGTSTMQALNGLSTLALADHFTTSAQLYGGFAWLSQQLLAQEQGPQTSAAILLQQEYQAAIWALADYTNSFTATAPNGVSQTQFNSDVMTLEGQAFSNRLSSGFEVLTQQGETAACSNCAQEYLVLTPAPEPGTLLLMGGGVVALLRRRFSKPA